MLLAVCGSNGLLRIFDFDECIAAMRADGNREKEDGQKQGWGRGDDGYWGGEKIGEEGGSEGCRDT